MFSLLFKKQFHEMFRAFFYDQRKGKLKSPGQIAGFSILIGFIFIAFFAMAFFLGFGMGAAFIPAGMDWFFFLITSALTIIAGTLGNAFTTFASLYKSKDNEALLAMPIPVKDIIGAKMVGVYVVGVVYTALIYFPFIISYWTMAAFSGVAFLCQILLYLAITLIVFALSCLFGYLIAKISLHVKNKGIVAVIVGVIFITLYMAFYIFVQPHMGEIIEEAAKHGEEIRSSVGILYDIGLIGVGSILPTIIVLGIALLLGALSVLLLVRSYISIVTSSDKYKKAVYVETKGKQASQENALLRKEFGRLLSSPAYLLNGPIFAIFLLVATIVLFFVGPGLTAALDEAAPMVPYLGSMIAISAFGMFVMVLGIGAPCVSLEGKALVQLQVLPIDMSQVVQAKLKLRFLVAFPASFVGAISVGYMSGDWLVGITSALTILVLYIFSSYLDVFVGVWKPLLEWNNETAAIKNNLNILILMLIGFIGLPLLFIVPYLFLAPYIHIGLYLEVLDVIFLLICVPVHKYLFGKGAKKLETL